MCINLGGCVHPLGRHTPSPWADTPPSPWADTPLPPGQTPPPPADTEPGQAPPWADTPLGRHPPHTWQTPPPTDDHCSGRYASYWNSCLVQFCLQITVTLRLCAMLPIFTETDHERERTRAGLFVNRASTVRVCFW